jgi:lipoprotein-anchoring transpeptidase ErfK/SrfK
VTDGLDPNVERLLAAAFDARARDAVDEQTTPPPPRFATPHGRTRRTTRLLAPLAAAAAVAATVAVVVTVAQSPSGGHHVAGTGPTPASSTAPTEPSTASGSSSQPAAATTPVHISLLNGDGDDYGVGMPVIAYFSKAITDARALQKATTVTVNGRPTDAAWYFERSAAGKGPIEGHLRPQAYWPAHSRVRVTVAAKGVSGGTGVSFDDSLTLDFTTRAANIAVVNDRTHQLTVTSDGKRLFTFPVSLGAESTPTSRGTKVIMEKGPKICMSGPGYHECGIKYTQRLTYGGEYLHSAPWNATHIRAGIDSSNGCTNLLPANAKQLYDTFRVGDIVQYPNADGAPMALGQGYGDWNVDWATWQTGGAVPTR